MPQVLVLSRKREESIRIGDDVLIKVMSVGNRVRLGFDAPENVRILREEMAAVDFTRVTKLREHESSMQEVHGCGWPRVWLAIGYCLPRRVRAEVFQLAFSEFVEDYIESRKDVQGKLAECLLTLAFTFRTLILVAQCLFVAMTSPIGRWLTAIGWSMYMCLNRKAGD